MRPEHIWRGFASDNYAGAHPEILQAMAEVNEGHQVAYGDDAITARLQEVVQENFGPSARMFPVFNGTGANVTALQAMTKSWQAVICSHLAHIHADEGGAPEKVAGLKLWPNHCANGKLTVDVIDQYVERLGDVHFAQPAVVYISQSTELGTVYRPDELKAITSRAHELGMKVMMDGARISNAAAGLGLPLRAITTDVGIDALSYGGTKNGAVAAEAVVALHEDAVPGFEFIRKSAMQLSSKMRFTSAQLLALLDGDLWLRNASHANDMAQRLAIGVRDLPGVRITQSVDANAVFAALPVDVITRLQQKFRFYTWDSTEGVVRWMCSWDTTQADVDAFVEAIKSELGI